MKQIVWTIPPGSEWDKVLEERIEETIICSRIQWNNFNSDAMTTHDCWNHIIDVLEGERQNTISETGYFGVAFSMLRRFHTIRNEQNCDIHSSHYPTRWAQITPLCWEPKSAILLPEGQLIKTQLHLYYDLFVVIVSLVVLHQARQLFLFACCSSSGLF